MFQNVSPKSKILQKDVIPLNAKRHLTMRHLTLHPLAWLKQKADNAKC